MRLRSLPRNLTILRLDGDAAIPPWARDAPLVSITRRAGELSIVAPEDAVPEGIAGEPGWRALEVEGPLDLSMTGVLAALAKALAEAGLPIFAVSTHDTDLILVRQGDLENAAAALRKAGHEVDDRA